MTFDNYIFDLYGTLIDIHTDEDDPALWQKTAEYFKEEFCKVYEPEQLREEYLRICAEEEDVLRDWLNIPYPEIRISWVFKRLIEGSGMGGFGRYMQEETITRPMRKLCCFFREASRDKMIIYPGVKDTFRALREAGKKIFLLSNAQSSFTAKELEDCGLDEAFDDIFISSDYLMKKPWPQCMDVLVTRNRLDRSSCVMIGNEVTCDVGVAAGSGIKSIFLNTYSIPDDRIKEELDKLEIKDQELMPQIIEDGDIRRILDF